MIIQKRNLIGFILSFLLFVIGLWLLLPNLTRFFGMGTVLHVTGKEELCDVEKKWVTVNYEYCFSAKLTKVSTEPKNEMNYLAVKLTDKDEYVIVIANEKTLSELEQKNYFNKPVNASKKESGETFFITGFVEKTGKYKDELIQLIRKYSTATYQKSTKESDFFDESFLLPNQESNTEFDYVINLRDPKQESEEGMSILILVLGAFGLFLYFIFSFNRNYRMEKIKKEEMKTNKRVY